MNITLAIINENNALYLKRLFESIGDWKKSLDIIFVDNCSSDHSVSIAKYYGIHNIINFKKRKESRPILYNSVIPHINREYVIYVHSDIIFGENYFNRISFTSEDSNNFDFVNFKVMYIDQISETPSITYYKLVDGKHKIRYQSVFARNNSDLDELMSCSDSCFMTKSALVRKIRFNEEYNTTYFIEEYIMTLKSTAHSNIYSNVDAYVQHYFVEEHERFSSLGKDSKTFIKNVLEKPTLNRQVPQSFLGKLFSKRQVIVD